MISRRSPRLRGWDYSTVAEYFITIVTKGRLPLLGAVTTNDEVARSSVGDIADSQWWEAVHRATGVESSIFVVMPNHFTPSFISGRVKARN